MNETFVIALISFAGTLIGSLAGILASNKLVNFRLQALEDKVSKHNNLVERTAVIERDLKTAFRILDERTL